MASSIIRKAWFGRTTPEVKAKVPATAGQVPEATFLSGLAPWLTAGTRTTSIHATILAGNIISSNPAAGTTQNMGTPVAYVVSTGP